MVNNPIQPTEPDLESLRSFSMRYLGNIVARYTHPESVTVAASSPTRAEW